MTWLGDDHAARVKEIVRDRRDQKDPQLASWTAKLLDDRAARSALIQRLSRQLHHVRQRLMQAARYVDGLLDKAAQTVGCSPTFLRGTASRFRSPHFRRR